MSEAKRKRRPLSARKRLVFALTPVVLLLGAWEGVCRVLPAPNAATRELSYLEADPELIWRLAPRAEGPQATNALGLRDTPYEEDAELKILLLGDSIAYGDGEPDLKVCFPQQLERELQGRDASRTVEVINAGVPGYSTFQQLRYLELKGLALKPQAVILQFCLNDVFERYTTVAAYGGTDRFFGIDTRSSLTGLHGWLVRHSRGYERVARWRQGRAKGRSLYTATALAVEPLAPELEQAWVETLADLERLQEVCAANGLPLLIALAPYRFQLEDPSALGLPQARLVAWAKTQGVPCVDLLDAFAVAHREGGAPLFFDANHFSPRGHTVATQALVGAVEALVRDVGH